MAVAATRVSGRRLRLTSQAAADADGEQAQATGEHGGAHGVADGVLLARRGSPTITVVVPDVLGRDPASTR